MAKKFPDLSGDGKVTQKDILMGKGVIEARKGKSVNLVCPRKEMAGALKMPKANTRRA
jgi:hypothetical protein|tara:strand:+ start:202 stop:375 length:174 start_codon:yes stop_codon:yes gene_type:complete